MWRVSFTASGFAVPALLAAWLTAGAIGSAQADSTSASSLSASLSTAVGSVSGSLTASSASSPGRAREVAAGGYTVVALGAAADPLREAGGGAAAPLPAPSPAAGAGDGGVVRVDLAGPAPLVLRLPAATVEAAGLAPGVGLRLSHRAYGLALARADTAEPFFLVLDDERHAELQARPVGPAAAPLAATSAPR